MRPCRTWRGRKPGADRADPAGSSPWAGQVPEEVHQGGLDLVSEVVQALEQVDVGDVEGMAGTAQRI